MRGAYDLGGLARRAGVRRSQIGLRPIGSRKADAEALRRLFVGTVNGLAEDQETLLRAAEAAQAALVHDDMGLNEQVRRLRASQETRLFRVRDAIGGLVRRVALRFDARWVEMVKAALGVDVRVLIHAGDVQATLALVVQKMAARAKSLSDGVANTIEAGLIALITQGASARDKAALIADTVAKARKAAERAARGEMEALNAVLNQFRQTQAGITEYEWVTREDERVRGRPQGRYPNARPSHWARHGKTFSWDKPPREAPYDGHPGEPPNCRCIARAIVSTEASSRARTAGLRAVAEALGVAA